MARLPYVDPETAPESVRETLALPPVPLNIFRMAAHAETNFAPLLRLGASILTQQELDAKIREFAVLLAAKIAGGRYEWIQHDPIAIACGATREQVDALEAGELTAACFNERERAALAFVEAAARDGRTSDAVFAATREHFNPREIVELILTIGFYTMMARLTEVTETDLDEPAGARIFDAIQGSAESS